MQRVKDILDRMAALEHELSASPVNLTPQRCDELSSLRVELAQFEGNGAAPCSPYARMLATKEILETTDNEKAARLISSGAWVVLGHYFPDDDLMWILGRIAGVSSQTDSHSSLQAQDTLARHSSSL